MSEHGTRDPGAAGGREAEAATYFGDLMAKQGTVPVDSADTLLNELQAATGPSTLEEEGTEEARQERARAALEQKMAPVRFTRLEADRVLNDQLAGSTFELGQALVQAADRVREMPDWSIQLAVRTLLNQLAHEGHTPDVEQLRRLQVSELFARAVLAVAEYHLEHRPTLEQ